MENENKDVTEETKKENKEEIKEEIKEATKEETKETIKEAIKDLSPREREILLLRYYIGKTQIEVSEEVGISQAQVSRLEKNALKTMKERIV